MPATWLEVALNGPWGPLAQPRIPMTVESIVEEGAACAAEGAAIVHVHAYDPERGRQLDDWSIYARVIEGIRARVDAVVYPTIPFPGAIGHRAGSAARERYAHVEALARRGLLEWSVVDPGSVNVTSSQQIAAGEEGLLYANPDSHIRRGMELAEAHGFHPGFAIYEPGFLRAGAAYERRYAAAPRAIYRFMFSERYAFGFPPERYALDAYLALLAQSAPGAPWMVAGLQVDVTPLIEPTVRAGGHVRVGLEDAPHGNPHTNLDWVREARRRIEAAGGTLADAPAVRAALAG